MPVILSRQDEMRIQRAMQNSESYKRKQAMQKQITEMRRKTEREKEHEQDLFRQWQLADTMLQTLEEIRDRYKPKTADEPWDSRFCEAVRSIPQVRRHVKDLWYEYTAMKGGG